MTSSSSQQLTYDAIMALQNSTFHHECFISVIQDASIPTILSTSSSSSSSSSPQPTTTNSPIIYCNFIFPIGLNTTVEVKDIPCSQFTMVASSTTIYNEGEATAILKPTISPEEKMSGEFTHEYCARIDILYDRDGDGFAESVLYNRFMIPITYRYEQNNNAAALLSARVDNGKEHQQWYDAKQTIGIALGAVVGSSLIMLLLVLLVRRFKRYRSNRRKNEQRNVEVTPVPNGLLI